MTRTRGSTAAANQAHVLNFDIDNDNDNCGLTILVKDFRFHIIADASDLLKPVSDHDEDKDGEEENDEDLSDKVAKIGEEFRRLVAALRAEQEEAEYRGDGRGEDKADKPTKPSKPSNKKTSHHEGDITSTSDSDSGVDVSSPAQKKEASPSGLTSPAEVEVKEDPETALRDWMLKPLKNIFEGLEPVPETGKAEMDRQTLQEWYSGPTYFYRLRVGQDGKLVEEQLETSCHLESLISKIVPRIRVPKSIHKLDIPWYAASNIEVVAAGDHCGLHGPTEVRIRQVDHDDKSGENNETDDAEMVYFFKRVDPAQAAPTKRELEMLKDVEAKGLHHKINVPLVKGIVRWYGSGSSGDQMMGFLQTAIEDPTPLTRMLDSDVVEEKREKWAKEAQNAITVLHDNDIVWGDAKADNFMVDRHGKLWIIDFGGSYTEGWVDPDLEETQEGDDMGVEKIVDALRDPENMTYDPDVGVLDASDAGEDGDGDEHGHEKKRARDVSAEESDDAKQPRKRARS